MRGVRRVNVQFYCLAVLVAIVWLLRNHAVWMRVESLPLLTLAMILGVLMFVLPADLAAFEPFDADAIRTAGWATIAIAIVGLVVAGFVPMAYCHYGCPTGALLNFIRSHGPAERFDRCEVGASARLRAAPCRGAFS